MQMKMTLVGSPRSFSGLLRMPTGSSTNISRIRRKKQKGFRWERTMSSFCASAAQGRSRSSFCASAAQGRSRSSFCASAAQGRSRSSFCVSAAQGRPVMRCCKLVAKGLKHASDIQYQGWRCRMQKSQYLALRPWILLPCAVHHVSKLIKICTCQKDA
ncbi:hypothetical protein COCON_G00191360 [Conger conger]|uniref:Uncharacterized protein n=1 Tax=Conger conger TaxID=82655 RepID=A0A9Q1HS00_CONCO|nr:hypothetical protein COCON_G00191360 [Conger conger]